MSGRSPAPIRECPARPADAVRQPADGGRSLSRLTEAGATAAAVFAVAVLAIVVYSVVSRGSERAQP